eukprot:CAMPEP_0195004072 /NCGR_PEP_ID=MMETSP0326_2-20130528/3962_1 /TAXON_ID=2866 ORGANISM="Crypthecodinium cohnii, Strain Seligo" /NCGR_SAMPLE_ID=MMETSP0326_2 /ASSEMBLY_ACC=CAM_ASM_000348 /LENGTH=41 /DNA_ID= /DNA_START= /DNA_END= /DNA_ORIENTATION=
MSKLNDKVRLHGPRKEDLGLALEITKECNDHSAPVMWSSNV